MTDPLFRDAQRLLEDQEAVDDVPHDDSIPPGVDSGQCEPAGLVGLLARSTMQPWAPARDLAGDAQDGRQVGDPDGGGLRMRRFAVRACPRPRLHVREPRGRVIGTAAAVSRPR